MAISSSSADSEALCCTALRSMVVLLSIAVEVSADEDVDGDEEVDDAGTVP